MITLEQARRLLPQDCALTDAELSSLLADLYWVANRAVSDVLDGRGRKEE